MYARCSKILHLKILSAHTGKAKAKFKTTAIHLRKKNAHFNNYLGYLMQPTKVAGLPYILQRLLTF